MAELVALDPDDVVGHIAIIIDNKVVMVMGASDKYYAALKSNPVFVDLKSNRVGVVEGDLYDPDKKTFYRPPIVPENQEELDIQSFLNDNPDVKLEEL